MALPLVATQESDHRDSNLVVLLPCYNEAEALPGLLQHFEELQERSLPYYDISILVVDDGSTDATALIGEAWTGQIPVQVIRHGVNKGLGAAVETGLQAFLRETQGQSNVLLAVMDADGTHPPALLRNMTRKLVTDDLDIVIASRFAPGGGEHGLTFMRLLYSRLAGVGMRIFAPVRGARDYSCGYRVYKRDAIVRAVERYGDPLVTERGFVCMVELLVKLARSGARVGEVGLDLHYELKQGASKMNVAATIRRYVAFALRARFDKRLR